MGLGSRSVRELGFYVLKQFALSAISKVAPMQAKITGKTVEEIRKEAEQRKLDSWHQLRN